MIKIGDEITYRGCWGSFPPKRVRVESIDIVEPGEKYGDQVKEVSEDLVRQGRVVFGLNDGHWCYARQVDLP